MSASLKIIRLLGEIAKVVWPIYICCELHAAGVKAASAHGKFGDFI